MARPALSATPVWRSAPLMKNTESMVITAGDANPWKASSGST